VFGVVGVTAGANVGTILPHSAPGFVTGESMTLLLLGVGFLFAGRFLRRPGPQEGRQSVAHTTPVSRLAGVRTTRVALAK
jgi:hypothetical protein